jgi:uncharacterized protein
VQAPRAARVTIDGPAGGLEALIEQPAGAPEAPPPAFGVVCHPHPLYGGSMDNKVVWTLTRAYQALGAATLRFNFRGVGASQGSYGAGDGESADALAVIEFARRRWPQRPLWLGGFSFGGAVAVRVAHAARPALVTAVAPGITVVDVRQALPPQCPWLIVQGDQDEVVPTAAVLEWARRLEPPPQISLMSGASHFFHGRINELREVLVEFLTRTAAGAAPQPPAA